MATNLTAECLAGYNAATAANPYYHSSDSSLAFAAGQKLAGMSGIKRCSKSRGYSVKVETSGGSIVLVSFGGKGLDIITMDRR